MANKKIAGQMNIDLSTKEHSMTSIIQNNHSRLDSAGTTAKLVAELKTLFAENELDAEASRRLIANVSKKKDFTSALMTVYDSMLYGSKLAVNQK